MRADLIDRAGTVDGYEVRPSGLWSRAVIEEGQVGDAILDLVAVGKGAASSGTMPHLIRREGDYMRRWPIVEWSVLDEEQAGSWPGTTKIEAIRAHLGGEISTDVIEIRRSVFMYEQGTNGNTPPTVQAENSANIGDAVRDLVARVEGMQADITAIREAPAQTLQPSPPPVAQPQISVRSKYDDVSLFGLLHRDEMQRIDASRQGRTHRRSEEFMRAVLDKARAMHEAQVDDAGIRAIDTEAYNAWSERVPHLRANEAMQSTLAGSGDELVPTLMSSVAHYEFRLASRVFSLLPSFQMPSQSYDYPTLAGGPRFQAAAEATDKDQANVGNSRLATGKPTTAKITFSAGEIGVLSLASRTFYEDAGLSVADALAKQFARNAARDIDYLLLNGDERTTSSNVSHTGDASATEWSMIHQIDGLRRIAQAASDSVAIATLATTSNITLQQLMGSRGIIGTDVQNLAVIVSPGVYYKLLALSDFQSMEKVGERATYLTGMVGQWFGMPVIVSDELELTAATGLVPSDHSSGTKGQLLIVHRGLNMIGFRRQVSVEQGHVPHTGLYGISATVRLDLQAMEAGSVAWGYNTTV